MDKGIVNLNKGRRGTSQFNSRCSADVVHKGAVHTRGIDPGTLWKQI